MIDSITQYDLDRIEGQATRANGGPRYACRFCTGTYVLFCCNPICRATGNRPALSRKHSLPRELIAGVIAERRQKRVEANQATEARCGVMILLLSKRLRAFRDTHPTRKYIVATMPVTESESRYGYWAHTPDDPFQDLKLPARLAIHWNTIRVKLADGTHKPSDALPEIDIREEEQSCG